LQNQGLPRARFKANGFALNVVLELLLSIFGFIGRKFVKTFGFLQEGAVKKISMTVLAIGFVAALMGAGTETQAVLVAGLYGSSCSYAVPASLCIGPAFGSGGSGGGGGTKPPGMLSITLSI
jgi:hypothetical protein